MCPVSDLRGCSRRYGFAEYGGLHTAHHTYVRSIHGSWLVVRQSSGSLPDAQSVRERESTASATEPLAGCRFTRAQGRIPASRRICEARERGSLGGGQCNGGRTPAP